MNSRIILQTKQKKEIPLKHISYDIQIREQVSWWQITQQYENIEEVPIEVFYTFPTPANASVYEFTAKVNDKVIKAVLKEKEEAKADYNKAISKGDGAFYMERVTSDIFNICLGNIVPNSNITIIIKYVVELQTEIDCIRLRLNIPLTIMPKYAPNTTYMYNQSSNNINKIVNPPKEYEKPYSCDIHGSISMHDGIISLDSKSCKIKMNNMRESSTDFEISDLEKLNEDVVIVIERGTPTSSCVMQNINTTLTNELYRFTTMVNIVPKYDNIPKVNPADVHYVILLDRSGSMGTSDMKYCKDGAKLFISALPTNSSYDMYCFDDRFEKFSPSDPTNSANSLTEAINWINSLYARGGTELHQALINVYDSIRALKKRAIVILLSDGGIINTDATLKLAKNSRNLASIFTIGIGSSVSQELITGLATMSGGKAEFVGSGSDMIKEKMYVQLKRAQQSLARSVDNNKLSIETEGKFKLVPEIIPTLFENDINTFYIFSDSPIKSVVYTQIDGEYEMVNQLIPKNMDDLNNQNYPIHRMGGIKLLEEMLHAEKNGNASKIGHMKTDQSKQEIIDTSIDLGILSSYTSFIGVEIKETIDKVTDECKLVQVPLQATSIEEYAAIAETAYCCSLSFNGPPCGITDPQGPTGGQGISAQSGGSLFGCDDSEESDCDYYDNDSDCDTGAGGFFSNSSYRSSSSTNSQTLSKPVKSEKELKAEYNILVTFKELPEYIVIDNILRGAKPGILFEGLNVSDHIYVSGVSDSLDGVYKVWNIGSDIDSWIIEKIVGNDNHNDNGTHNDNHHDEKSGGLFGCDDHGADY